MTPEGTRVRRRNTRRMWRGVAKGRRSTHKTATTYGTGQYRRDLEARWAAIREAEREQAA